MGLMLVLFGEIRYRDSPVRGPCFFQALVVEFGWVPLSGLSWLPYKIACGPPLLHQAPSPHPSIVDGFNEVFWSVNRSMYSNYCLLLAQN